MSPLARAFAIAAALSLASAGADVALVCAGGRGFLATDAVVLLLAGACGAFVLLVPAALVAARAPERAAGLLVGAVVLVHALVAVRFGPLVNAPLRSPEVLGTIGVLGAGLLGLGALVGPWIDRVPLRAWAAVGGLGVVGLIVGVARVVPSKPPPTAAGPSLVLITMDTTRRDALGCYGNTVVETPNLDRLAADGVRFDQAIAGAPQTGPAHLSLLSGEYPTTTGVVSNGTVIGDHPELLARVLAEAGYATAGFVAAFPVHERYGFRQGFQTFDSDFSPLPGLHDLAPVGIFDLFVLRNLPRERRGDAVNARAIRWLNHANGPFFLWVHYYDPHGPYTPPPAFDRRYVKSPPAPGPALDLPAYWPADQRAIADPAFLQAQYEAEVAFTDSLVGELLTVVDRVSPDRIVVATADHGESMTEHGVLFDHGDDLYDPALRVPLIVEGGGLEPAVVGVQVPMVDLVPTVLEILGVPDKFSRDGRSRAADLRGTPGADDDAFASTVSARHEDPPVDHAIRRPSGKCVARGEAHDHVAWDLAADPGESVDVFATSPAAKPLCDVLDARVRDATLVQSASDATTDQMLIQLGYKDGK
jgi:arylsulfatase A-like enzyme